MRPLIACGLLSLIAGCAGPTNAPEAATTESPVAQSEPRAVSAAAPAPAGETPTGDLRQVFPHVWVDAAAGIVELDGLVPINAHDDEKPRVYLEVCVCTPDTKEHESLVMTHAKPSDVHAALLLLGLEPGTPGDWDWQGAVVTPIPPTGPRVNVDVRYDLEGRVVQEPITDWAVSISDGKPLTVWKDGDGFVFSGSQMLRRRNQSVYRADGEGCLVGLTAFGGETVAWSRMFHHDSGMEEPMWIARRERVPPFGTAVKIRLSRMPTR